MYEDQTYDIILERMMNRVSDKIDKRPSSPVYDLHSSTAIEFQILYIELEYLIKNSYGDTAAREFLILLAKDGDFHLNPQPRQSYRVSSHQQTLMLLESVSTLVKSTML